MQAFFHIYFRLIKWWVKVGVHDSYFGMLFLKDNIFHSNNFSHSMSDTAFGANNRKCHFAPF